MDYFLTDNFNITWHEINNPVPFVYVRKNETLTVAPTVSKTEKKEKLKEKTVGLCGEAETAFGD